MEIGRESAYAKLEDAAFTMRRLRGDTNNPTHIRKAITKAEQGVELVKDNLGGVMADNAEFERLDDLRELINRLGVEQQTLERRHEDRLARSMAEVIDDIYDEIQIRRRELGDPDADIVDDEDGNFDDFDKIY